MYVLQLSALATLAASVSALVINTPVTPWVLGSNVTITWGSQSGDPSNIGISAQNYAARAVWIINASLPTSQGSFEVEVSPIIPTGEWVLEITEPDSQVIYAESGSFLIVAAA